MTEATRIQFAVPCGNGHLPTHSFSALQLADLIARDELSFFCALCGTSRKAMSEEKHSLLKLIEDLGDGTK